MNDFWAVARARIHGYQVGFDEAIEILEAEKSHCRELGHSRKVRHLTESIQILKMNRPKLRDA